MSTTITSSQRPPHDSPRSIQPRLTISNFPIEPQSESESESESDSLGTISEASISSYLYLIKLNKQIQRFARLAVFDDIWWNYWLRARLRKARFLGERGIVYYLDKSEGGIYTTEDELSQGSVDDDPDVEEEEEEEGEEVFQQLRNSGNTLTKQDKLRRLKDWVNRLVDEQRTPGQAERSQSQSERLSKTSDKNICQGPKAKTAPISRKRNLDQVEQPISEREERTKTRRR